MRIILIRHAQSTNNVLSEESYDTYANGRSEDPSITETSKIHCATVGKFLRDNSFPISKFYSSCSLRAITTMNIIAEAYNSGEGLSAGMELLVGIHEFGGMYLKDQAKPGMTGDEIVNMFPMVQLPENEDLSSGWWKSDGKETEEQFRERVKGIFVKLKEMAVKQEEKYTICLISHGLFLNAFFSLINNNVDYLVESRIDNNIMT